MLFNLKHTIKLLSHTPLVLEHLLSSIPEEWVHQNEGPKTWSPYNILGHLIHGEKTDWIPRARITLFQSNKSFEPYDRTAQECLDQTIPLGVLLNEFDKLRKANLEEMCSWDLNPTQLSLKGFHPELGEVTLQELIATWLVHDYSHIHQMTRVLGKNYSTEVGPWSNFINMIKK